MRKDKGALIAIGTIGAMAAAALAVRAAGSSNDPALAQTLFGLWRSRWRGRRATTGCR